MSAPNQLDGAHQTLLHSLSAKAASEFDAAYARQMAQAHAAAVTLFKDESSVSDKELAGFAKKTLPVLLEHKQMADALNSRGSKELPAEKMPIQ